MTDLDFHPYVSEAVQKRYVVARDGPRDRGV